MNGRRAKAIRKAARKMATAPTAWGRHKITKNIQCLPGTFRNVVQSIKKELARE